MPFQHPYTAGDDIHYYVSHKLNPFFTATDHHVSCNQDGISCILPPDATWGDAEAILGTPLGTKPLVHKEVL